MTSLRARTKGYERVGRILLSRLRRPFVEPGLHGAYAGRLVEPPAIYQDCGADTTVPEHFAQGEVVLWMGFQPSESDDISKRMRGDSFAAITHRQLRDHAGQLVLRHCRSHAVDKQGPG